jgi:hypothetical protein
MVASKEKDERNVMWHVTLRYRTGQLSQVFVQNMGLATSRNDSSY